MAAIDDIAAERKRQIEEEGYPAAVDDRWRKGELASAAASYAFLVANVHQYLVASDGDQDSIDEGYASGKLEPPAGWPWEQRFWKPKDPRRDLVRAGALIVAEIERLDRAAARKLS